MLMLMLCKCDFDFFADNNFSQATSRLSLAKMTSFSMSPAAATSEQRHHVVAFVAGQKGGPAIAKLFGYPRFNPEKDAIISKSFFNADKLETEWSKGSWPFISLVNYFSIPRHSTEVAFLLLTQQVRFLVFPKN